MQHTHISADHRLLDLKLDEVWQYRGLIWLFTKRSFVVAYKQTILGPLWLFLVPLMTGIVYVLLHHLPSAHVKELYVFVGWAIVVMTQLKAV